MGVWHGLFCALAGFWQCLPEWVQRLALCTQAALERPWRIPSHASGVYSGILSPS